MIRTTRNHTLESRKGIMWEFPDSPVVRIQSFHCEGTKVQQAAREKKGGGGVQTSASYIPKLINILLLSTLNIVLLQKTYLEAEV